MGNTKRLVGSELSAMVDKFLGDLRQGKFVGSLALSEATVGLLKCLVGSSKWTNAQEIMDILTSEAQILNSAFESETTVMNLVRRVLKLIRDEYATNYSNTEEVAENEVETGMESLQQMMKKQDDDDEDPNGNGSSSLKKKADYYKKSIPDLRGRIIESIEELSMELETSCDDIAGRSLEHIHANEVILTIGKSHTVEKFLKHAASKNRTFQVIVAESGPFCQGQELATSLAKAKIHTTLITDSAIFAMMARVNKVIIGTHSVLANGGLKAIVGSYTVALAAKHYSVPLIVLSPMYKLTPVYASTVDEGLNKFASPQDILTGLDGKVAGEIRSVNPIFEYVPPELVTLFISNVTGHAPSYVYRLLNEYYHPDDYEL